MFLLLTRDKHIVFIFSFFFGAVAERRYAVAVLFVREPLAFVSKTSERERKATENDLLASHGWDIANNAPHSLQTVAPF